MKIGIIGAENSHTAAIAKTINVNRKIRGFTVDCVWGETDEFACKAAEAGRIPNIVREPAEMLGKIDALIVDHRHAKFHLRAAAPFVKAGIPAFIDKPFCYRLAEGRAFLREARRRHVPVTSFSTLPHQASYRQFEKEMAKVGDVLSASLWGPCDLESIYGGIFFYGVHQVELALTAFAGRVASVRVTRNGANATGQLLYEDGKIVTLNLIKEGCPGFRIAVVGRAGSWQQALPMDKDPYLNGVKTFTKMFRTGVEPCSHERILQPIAVLEALEKSVSTGKTVPLPA